MLRFDEYRAPADHDGLRSQKLPSGLRCSYAACARLRPAEVIAARGMTRRDGVACAETTLCTDRRRRAPGAASATG